MNRTAIEWCDFTWNPVVGCTLGCAYCYARKQAKRFKHRCQQCYDFVPHLHPERLGEPAKRKKPSRIFVCSMGELFDPALPSLDCKFVLGQIWAVPRHTFIVLTKRPERVLPVFSLYRALYGVTKNLWLGTSICNQADADKRIPELLKCDAAVRFVSYEPAHGPVDLHGYYPVNTGSFYDDLREAGRRAHLDALTESKSGGIQGIDWLIIGAETGNRKGKVVPRRDWIQSAIDQCRDAGVPVFVKDNVVKLYPEFAGIREWPKGGE